MDGMALLVAATAAAGLLWKSGIADRAGEKLGRLMGQACVWVANEEGAWADLPSRLAYRDFFSDVIETRDGWMWAGLELRPIASEGFDGFDWNAAEASRHLDGRKNQTEIQSRAAAHQRYRRYSTQTSLAGR